MSLKLGNGKKRLVVIAHNIRSLHNIGSIFRTADAAGVAKIYLTGYSGSPDDPKAAKVALGAERAVPWERIKNISTVLRRLAAERYQIIALEQDPRSIPYRRFKPRFPAVLIVGNEVRGISRALRAKAGAVIEIPMRGTKESLNVSVAFGIAVFHILKS